MMIQSPTANIQQPAEDGEDSAMCEVCLTACFSDDVKHISEKIESVTLSGAIKLSLDMQQQQQQNLFEVSKKTIVLAFELPSFLNIG